MIKVLPVVSGLLSADAATKMFFGTNIKEFLIGGLGNQPNPQAGGTYGQAITLPELFGYVTTNQGGQFGIHPADTRGLGGMIMDNVQMNFIPSALQFAAAAAIPKILTKTGVKRNANNLLKGFGLNTVVQM
tara:strand:+ start:392 stop:784 length:393 start_codon:yes stop_codon:yes gene_type:complete